MKAARKSASAAQEAILELHGLAAKGDREALEELWRIGMLACSRLDDFAMNVFGEEVGKATRAMARKKTSWPFQLAAVHEIRHAKNNAANPDALADWIGLGADTGIKLANSGKGRPRSFKRGTTTGLAYYVRRQIEEDLKTYGHRTDAEILNGRYGSWPYRDREKPNRKDQENLLAYINAARAISNIHDEGQWMKAATLWLEVTYQGRVNDDDGTLERWPQDIYERARKGQRNLSTVVLDRLQEGFANIVKPLPVKKPIG